MKFDEVIINENKLGDWMFGDKRYRGQGGMGGTGGPTVKAPSLGLKGGLTKQDKLAYKLFVRDFVSDALSTIDSGLRAGLINPPVRPNDSKKDAEEPQPTPQGTELDPNIDYDKPAYQRQGKDLQFEKMDRILESIIGEQPQQTDVEQAGGRLLSVFIRDWFGQWMQNVDYTKSKDVLYQIIDNLEHVYNNSKNPAKPDIDRDILSQLADGAWSATSTVGVTPIGAKNAQGAEVIQKSVEKPAQGAKEPELKSKETPMKPLEIPAGIAIKDAGGTEYFYNGKQWTDSSGNSLSAEAQQKYSKMYAMDPKTFYKTELTPPKKSVKESKTQSAIRAEKVALLKSR
jgi:hypothetical protein